MPKLKKVASFSISKIKVNSLSNISWVSLFQHGHFPQKHELQVSQGKVETVFRRGGKCVHFCTTNLLRTTCTKFYYNRSRFVDCISKKNLGVFFGSQCLLHIIAMFFVSRQRHLINIYRKLLAYGNFVPKLPTVVLPLNPPFSRLLALPS